MGGTCKVEFLFDIVNSVHGISVYFGSEINNTIKVVKPKFLYSIFLCKQAAKLCSFIKVYCE